MVSHCAPRLPAATALVFLQCHDMADTAPYRIRTFGDPVLKRRAEEITDIDGRVARLAEDMHATLKLANGLGLAARTSESTTKRSSAPANGRSQGAPARPSTSDKVTAETVRQTGMT